MLHEDVRPETEAELRVEVVRVIACIQREFPREVRVITVHLLLHLVDQRSEGTGPLRALSMFGAERWHGWLQGLIFSMKSPVASIAQRYDIFQLLMLIQPVLERLELPVLKSSIQ
jgi:hypothetical protein